MEALNDLINFVANYGSYDEKVELRRLTQLKDVNGIVDHCQAVVSNHLASITGMV